MGIASLEGNAYSIMSPPPAIISIAPSQFGSCFFGYYCSFPHSHSIPSPSDHTPSSSEEFILLQQQVTHLESVITCLSKCLNEISLSQSQHQNSPPPSLPPLSFHCDHCDYSSTTSHGLKTCLSRKHKQETLRENLSVDFDYTSLSVDHRTNPAPSPSIPLDTLFNPSPSPQAISCSECREIFCNQSDLKIHIETSHASQIAPK